MYTTTLLVIFADPYVYFLLMALAVVTELSCRTIKVIHKMFSKEDEIYEYLEYSVLKSHAFYLYI